MQSKPMIAPALLQRHEGLLEGPITPGEVFAWEPDLPHARELVIVRRLYERAGRPWVETWDMEYRTSYHNEESRFREAAVRTPFAFFPVEPPPLVLGLPSGLTAPLFPLVSPER